MIEFGTVPSRWSSWAAASWWEYYLNESMPGYLCHHHLLLSAVFSRWFILRPSEHPLVHSFLYVCLPMPAHEMFERSDQAFTPVTNYARPNMRIRYDDPIDDYYRIQYRYNLKYQTLYLQWWIKEIFFTMSLFLLCFACLCGWIQIIASFLLFGIKVGSHRSADGRSTIGLKFQ